MSRGQTRTYNARMTPIPDIDTVRDYLTGLQDRICAAIEVADGGARFHETRGKLGEPRRIDGAA